MNTKGSATVACVILRELAEVCAHTMLFKVRMLVLVKNCVELTDSIV